MPVEVIMPKVDMDMTEGTFATWHVAEGDSVAKGAALFDIETDKSAMEVEAPASGRLHHLSATSGDRIAVGAAIGWIYAEGETVGPRPGVASDATADAVSAAVADDTADVPPSAAAVAVPASATTAAMPDAGTRATPAARHLARSAGLTLTAISGTGPQGRIQRSDVASRIAAAAPAPAVSVPTPQPAPAPQAAHVHQVAPVVARATADGGALHVSRRPGTGVPLVLIHGFAADSMGWAAFERDLPRDLPLIRIDLPAHGRSPRQTIGSFQDLLRSVTRAFDDAIDGPVHVLGHSLGGAVSLGLADIRPRQTATLTLIAPAGLGPEIDAAALHGIARASRTESLAPWLQRLTARPDRLSWDFAQAAMLARNDPALRAAQEALTDVLFPDGVQGFDLRAALARVTAPSVMVWGRDDHILPWRHALSAGGDTALHLLPGVGHVPHIECPADLARIVTRLLGHRVGA